MPMKAKLLSVMALLLSVMALLLLTAAGCSGASEPEAAETPEATQAETSVPKESPLIKGPVSDSGLQIIFGTPDLGVGPNRIGFVLTSKDGIVTSPAVSVTSEYLPEGGAPAETGQTALAVFRPWPYGTRGLYTTVLDFHAAGDWALRASVLDLAASGDGDSAELFFEVAETTHAPATGQPAVASDSKTLADVAGFEKITTGSLHDGDLYEVSIADAVASGRPTVIVVASPAFCTNAVCGPQVDVLKELKDKYRGRANFIHVDYFDNPDEIQGDLDRAIVSPTVLEWNLPSTEWSFVVDGEGVVTARFEAFATLEELEEALLDVL